ncbi:MAG: hypothetical protein AMXMBFR12_08380 [Candidatus Babeliales bacterium]
MKSIKLFLTLLFLVPSIYADVIGTQVQSLAIALQSNARIVTSGFANNCDKDQVISTRFLTDGTLDGSYNGTGYNMTIFGGSAFGKAVTVQPSDQKIVVAGFSDDTIGVLRFTTGGALDSAFGTNGRVNLNLGINETGNAVAMQSGKILVAGNATVGGVTQFFVTRLNANGALDVGFGTSGITTTPIGDGCTANAMGIQSTGRIVLAGTAVISGQVVFALARYTSSGILDTTFGTSGTTNVSIADFAVGNAIAIDSSNKIIVAGYAINGGDHQIAVARFTANGTLDGTFGTSGIVLHDIPSTDIDHGLGVAIQADGNIVVAGSSGTDALVMRLNIDGSLDTTFGGGAGYVLTPIGDEASATAVAIQPADQMIVIAGISDLSAFVARYDVDGNLDATFGDSGTGYNINPQGSLEATCGNCTVCPVGPTGATGATGIASLGSYAYFYNSSLTLDLSVSPTAAIPYNNEGIKSNITHSTVTNSDQITILSNGVYKITAVIDLDVASQSTNFALLRNGSSIPGTNFSLAGTGAIVMQATLAATAADVIQAAQLGVVATTISGNTTITLEQIA